MRILSLIFIAIVTFLIVLVVKRPELFKDFWLWLIGLSGLILQVVQEIWGYIKNLLSKSSGSAKQEISNDLKDQKTRG